MRHGPSRAIEDSMRAGRLMPFLFALAVLAVRPFAQAQQGRPVNVRTDSDKTIASLRQVANDLDDAVKRTRQVTRTIILVVIDSKSGSQIPASRELKSYPVEAGDSLEEIYDENAAQ
jgi:hypothetical protein